MTEVPEIILRTFLVMAVIIGLTRMNGLRSFSKMSGFDFAVTVAIGSVLAGAITATDKSLWLGIGGILGLFAFQALVARVRARSPAVERALDNRPLIVMRDGKISEANLKKAGMSKSDVAAKLREANALRVEDIHAVVVESTGDVSVLHGEAGDGVSPMLLEGLRD